jgi:hypothetical protein
MRASKWLGMPLAAGFLALGGIAQAQLSFNFTFDSGVSASYQSAIQQAAGMWSNLLTNPIVINVDVLPDPSVLARATAVKANYDYSTVRTALIAGATSADDATAVANLQTGPAFVFLVNGTAEADAGGDVFTPYLDDNGSANNTEIRLSNANAKALGIFAGPGGAIDFTIRYKEDASFWDIDRTDGIDPGQYDFIGAIVHEIGHGLGFLSGVDSLDDNVSNQFFEPEDTSFYRAHALDLFRYSTESLEFGPGVFDWTLGEHSEEVGQVAKYFSIDGGLTELAQFSTGEFAGDGQQPSHWKDDLGIGIFDPTAEPGDLLTISGMDLRAMDVIGYQVAAAVPEPSVLLGTAVGIILFGGRVLRGRRRG